MPSIEVALCFFRPASSLNSELVRAWRGNVLSVIRQVAYLRAAPESEYVAIGASCVDEIEARLDAEEGLIWNFVDLDPEVLREIETAVAMGLQITAMGEFAVTTPLVQAQAERARQRVVESDYGSAETAFVVSEVSDSIVGRIEKLVSYKCAFENPENLVVLEGKSVVLS